MDATTRIRNLSIALEVIHKLDLSSLNSDIYELLKNEIQKFKEKKGLPARPATTSANDNIPS